MNPYWYRKQTGTDEKAGPANPITNYVTTPTGGERRGDPPAAEEVQGFQDMWHKARQSWKDSETRSLVLATFKDPYVKERLKTITKIIAFGNGSLWRLFKSNASPNFLERCAAQHAVIEEIRTYIEMNGGSSIRSYAQEPEYTSEDVAKILGDLQVERLHDPNGLLEIDDQTLVFSIDPDFALLQIIADIAKPAMLFYKAIEEHPEWEDCKDAEINDKGAVSPVQGYSADPTSLRVQDLLQGYSKYTINDPTSLFNGPNTRLYVRN